MIDIENEVISIVHDVLEANGINASLESVLNLTPPTFPTVCVEEISNSSYDFSADSKSVENHAEVGYEINIFTNSLNGKKSEGKGILKVIDDKLISIGFTRISKTQLALDEGTKFRLIARYSATVGKNDIIYGR